MTKNSHPTCPICNEPWISTDGKWQICADCPYRGGGFEGDSAATDFPDIQAGEEVTVTLNVPLLFRRLAEQAVRIRELERELARARFEAHFRPADGRGDNDAT